MIRRLRVLYRGWLRRRKYRAASGLSAPRLDARLLAVHMAAATPARRRG